MGGSFLLISLFHDQHNIFIIKIYNPSRAVQPKFLIFGYCPPPNKGLNDKRIREFFATFDHEMQEIRDQFPHSQIFVMGDLNVRLQENGDFGNYSKKRLNNLLFANLKDKFLLTSMTAKYAYACYVSAKIAN